MKAAIYARVSTERQAERGTIGSQLEALRAHLAAEGHELAGEYCDDGHSGARLDRPGLDALRDAAEAGLFDVVCCLSPDRLARSYAYQVLILDELARLGVQVAFTDAPGLDQDDPQAKLLTQVQGVIAEYERAKIGERYRRGKLFRSRAGEVISRKAPYGYRRIPRSPEGPAHLEIYEPEAAIARQIFAERAAGTTIRQICRQLNAGAVPTPTGSRAVWGTSTINRLLRSEAYIGRVYYNRTETVPARRPGQHSRQVPRPRDEWIAIPCPPLIADETFEAASKVSADNSKWSPRRAEPGAWLLRGLVKCGPCGVGTSCHKMRGRNGTWHRYYYCHNHDPLRAGGQDRRCPERNIRAGALDEFVFAQIRAALLDPGLLLAGEQAIAVHAPVPDDQLLAAELARLDRRLDTARGEHSRLIDLYQASLIDMPELQRRVAAITARQRDTEQKRTSLAAERADLARGNRLRHGIQGFAARVAAVIDQLDPAQRQNLLRLLIEDVQVTGWHVKIRLRIPLDNPPDSDHTHRQAPSPGPTPASTDTAPVSTEDRLRSLHDDLVAELRNRGVRYAAGRDMLGHRIAHVILTRMEAAGETCDDRTHDAVRRSRPVRAAVDAIWPKADPVKLVLRLLSDRALLAAAADGLLEEAEQDLIAWRQAPRGPASALWTLADAVLVDEASDLIERTPSLSHVVLDEAQDLSPMECRAVGRRCTTGSATVLGDLAQGTAPAATDSWATLLGHLGKGGADLRELRTGYRVPRQILDFANQLLGALAPGLAPASSLRQDPAALAVLPVTGQSLPSALATTCDEARQTPGSIAVIAADDQVGALSGLLGAARLAHRVLDGLDPDPGDSGLLVVPVTLAKGLEFDHVIVVEPARIVAAESRGLHRLYVALTRAVSRLTVLHTEPLPTGLSAPM